MRREKRATKKLTQPVNTTAAPTQLDAASVEQQIANLNGNPASALAFSSFTPGPGQTDPRDSKYWANVNNLLFNTTQDYSRLGLQGQQAALDHERGLSDMATGRSREQRALAEEAMRSGLASSGWRDRSDAEQTFDFLRDSEDYQTDYSRSDADRKSAMSRVIQDFIAGERDLSLDAVSAYDEQKRKEAADAAPVYTRRDVRALDRILGGNKRRRHGRKKH